MLQTKQKRNRLTPTVRRNAFWNAIVILAIFVGFNFFSLITLNYHLQDLLDTRLRHETEHLYLSMEYQNGELVITNPNELKESDLAQMTEDPFFLQVYDLDSNILQTSDNLVQFKPIPIRFPQFTATYHFEDIDLGTDMLRTSYQKLFDENGVLKAYLQVSAINTGFNKLTKSMIYFNIITLPLVLVVIFLVSIFLAKRGLTRVNKIIELANIISVSNLEERIVFKTRPDDELGRLKDTLNSLFDRLARQVDQISDFSDNASHQLMTPLTAINAELDYLLKANKNDDDFVETIKVLKKETSRMTSIVKTLLILAKECNECSDKHTIFNLSTLILQDTIDVFKSEPVKFSADKDIHVRGRADYFSMVINNLIDNALKYSDSQPVEVTLTDDSGFAVLKVSDTGKGISDADKQKIFERFYRGKNADEVEGNGLGLSLVHSITDSMSGSVKVNDNIPCGTTFIVTLPKIIFSQY